MRANVWGAAGLLLSLAGCVSLPVGTQEDVTRARSVYPELTLASLTEARKTYVRICSGCHALHLPAEFPAPRWPGLVEEMVSVQKVKLTGEQRQQIETFLIVMAGAMPDKGR
jgi:hypothetical protein